MLFSIWVAGDPHINLCVGQSDIARKRKDGKCVDGVRKWLGQWGRNSKGGQQFIPHGRTGRLKFDQFRRLVNMFQDNAEYTSGLRWCRHRNG